MKKLIWLCLIIFGFNTIAQRGIQEHYHSDVFGLRAFIENKGQFNSELKTNQKVLFAYEADKGQIFFTPTGLVYKFIKRNNMTIKQHQTLLKGFPTNVGPDEVHYVYMTWKNANSNIEVKESERVNHYFTYGTSDKNANGFKKIVYKNVYTNIDIKYIIPSNKTHGIKYNVIVHPGAKATDIQIAYSGDIQSMAKTSSGEISIKTLYDEIIEHAPYSHLENESSVEIKSKFQFKENEVSFVLPNGYDKTKTLVIDPWITTTTSLTTSNSGYDVDYDYAGNLYVFGGTSPFKVCKYNISGALQWTFQGQVSSTTPPWSTNYSNYIGGFAVNKTTAKTYINNPYETNGTRVIRLNTLGAYDNFITVPTMSCVEGWDMAYRCTDDKIITLGGAWTCNIASVDQTAATLTMNYVYTTSGFADMQNGVFDSNGDLYVHHSNNIIKRITSALTTSVWSQPSTFNNLTYMQAKNSYVSTTVLGQGFNCLAVNNNFLYFYDGYNLAAYNKANGNLVGSTTIPGHVTRVQGGIDCDECDNIYIGGNAGNIKHYYFNGSSFSAQSVINLNATTTNQHVYDIKLNKAANLLYFSGSGFAGTIGANSSTCTSSNGCAATIPPTFTTICFGSTANINIVNINNLTNPSYSVQPGSLTSTSPNFTVSPAVTTIYTVYVTGLNASSAIETNTSIATVSVVPTPSTNPILTNGTCANPVTSSVNLNVTFNPSGSPNYTTTWNPFPSTVTTVNSPTAAGLVPGVNSVTLTTEHGCKTVVSFTVPPIPLTASFVIVNPSNDYTVTCQNPNVLLTTSVTNGVPLTFVWMPSCTGTTSGVSMNFTQACTGQVVGTSSTGCTFAQTFTVYQNYASPTIAVTPTVVNITCTTTPLTFTGTSNMGPNVTTNWFQIVGSNTVYVGAASGTINIFQPGQPGIFWFESVNNLTGCKSTKSVEVTASVGVPIFTVTSPNNFTVGCSTKSISSMQVSTVVTSPTLNVSCYYSFVPPPGTLVPTYSPQPNVVTTGTPGTWVVYVRDQTNNCISSQSITIIQNITPPNIDFIQPLSILSCRQPSMVLSGISSNTNTTITWTVPAPPSSSVFPAPNVTVTILPSVSNSSSNITTIGTYTVGAVDNNNLCTSRKTIQINQDIRIPKFTITAQTNSAITCANLDVLLIPVVNNTLAAALVPTFVWYPPIGSGVPGSLYNTISAGSHTAISTSAINGCTDIATYNVAINQTPPAIDQATPSFTLDCNTNPTVSLYPTITGTTTGFTYSWTAPFGALTSNLTKSVITSDTPGPYVIIVTNTLNGCVSQALYNVVEGNIKADFEAVPDYGFAPLPVTFNNLSSTSTGATGIISTWGYGNGAVTQTVLNTVPVSTTYTAAGTYSVLLTVRKGSCIDSKVRVVTVELASKLEVPNVFTPNGDKSNDIFKLKATNLSKIDITIFDRWGTLVYEVHSETGNFAWDGKNQLGKECAEGTYFYIIKAEGKDNKEFEQKGNVSLFR